MPRPARHIHVRALPVITTSPDPENRALAAEGLQFSLFSITKKSQTLMPRDLHLETFLALWAQKVTKSVPGWIPQKVCIPGAPKNMQKTPKSSTCLSKGTGSAFQGRAFPKHSELHSRPTEIFENHSKSNPGVNRKANKF